MEIHKLNIIGVSIPCVCATLSLPQLVVLLNLDHGISNSARLGFRQVVTHCVGIKPIPLDVKRTCSLLRPFVKGSEMFSFDLM